MELEKWKKQYRNFKIIYKNVQNELDERNERIDLICNRWYQWKHFLKCLQWAHKTHLKIEHFF